ARRQVRRVLRSHLMETTVTSLARTGLVVQVGWSGELGQREHVAVGVGEPGDLGAGGSGPYAQRVLVHAVVAGEADAAVAEVADGCGDVVDAPPADRVARGTQLGHHSD